MNRKSRNHRRQENPKLDELKLQLCNQIRRVIIRQHWNSSEAAVFCGTNRSCIAQVFQLQTEKLTLNQLFNYLARIEPGFQMLISI